MKVLIIFSCLCALVAAVLMYWAISYNWKAKAHSIKVFQYGYLSLLVTILFYRALQALTFYCGVSIAPERVHIALDFAVALLVVPYFLYQKNKQRCQKLHRHQTN